MQLTFMDKYLLSRLKFFFFSFTVYNKCTVYQCIYSIYHSLFQHVCQSDYIRQIRLSLTQIQSSLLVQMSPPLSKNDENKMKKMILNQCAVPGAECGFGTSRAFLKWQTGEMFSIWRKWGTVWWN